MIQFKNTWLGLSGSRHLLLSLKTWAQFNTQSTYNDGATLPLKSKHEVALVILHGHTRGPWHDQDTHDPAPLQQKSLSAWHFHFEMSEAWLWQ